jgi:hypothetical protein
MLSTNLKLKRVRIKGEFFKIENIRKCENNLQLIDLEGYKTLGLWPIDKAYLSGTQVCSIKNDLVFVL